MPLPPRRRPRHGERGGGDDVAAVVRLYRSYLGRGGGLYLPPPDRVFTSTTPFAAIG